MYALMGGFVASIVGLGAWFLARYFVARSDSGRGETVAGHDSAFQPNRFLREAHGAITLGAALTSAGMAVWGIYLGWKGGTLVQITAILLITGLLLAIALVDFQVRRIPNALVLALLVAALVQVLWLGQPEPLAAIVGFAVGGGLFLLLALIRRGALGAGDVKLAAALGALLGFPLVLPGLLIGALAGGVAALLLLITHRAGRKDYMAYGPYLALGAWLVWTGSLGLWS